MLINPFETNESNELREESEKYYSNENVVLDIITYLIENHQDVLIDDTRKNNKKKVEDIIRERIINYYGECKENIDEILKKILDRFYGYYILQELIDNLNITDIRTIDYKTIYCKKFGKWEKVKKTFQNEKDYASFVRNCVVKNGGRINNEYPICVVSDKEKNLRIEAGIDPVNICAPNLVIRIHRKNGMEKLEDILLSEAYMFNSEIYLFLYDAVISGANILISGKGGSGKTTLLRTLVNAIPSDYSVTSNEETAEIFSNHPNIIEREIVQNRTKEKNITLEMLMKQCLVMSNDAIIVGELKGEETMTFIDAVFTGHIGFATIHANNAKNTIPRIVTLMKKDPKTIQYTTEYLEQIVSSSIDIIIYMSNFKVCEIMEMDYDYQNKKVEYNLLYEFCVTNIIDSKLVGYFRKKAEVKFRLKEKMRINGRNIKRRMNYD